MNRILVPCDFSQPAQAAYQFAIQLANVTHGEIFVLKVIELPMTYEASFGMPVYTFESGFISTLKKDDIIRFEKLKEKYGTGSTAVYFETEYGYVTTSIEQYAQSKNIDLIIMGTHGSEGWEEYLIGSNTEKIVRRATVPVLAIRKTRETFAIANIVFPSSLQLKYDKLMDKVKELQRLFDAKLHVLFVNTPGQFKRQAEARKLLDDFAQHYHLKNFTLNLVNDTNEQDGIINFAMDIKADLIAMGTHGRKGLAHLFSGSIAENVVNHSHCAIWMCRVET